MGGSPGPPGLGAWVPARNPADVTVKPKLWDVPSPVKLALGLPPTNSPGPFLRKYGQFGKSLPKRHRHLDPGTRDVRGELDTHLHRGRLL
jgi:hypothetical protein